MTVFGIITFIAFLWIAHGFWRDYVESKRPRTEEEKEQIHKQINELELELFHKRLYLKELASPWKPKCNPKPLSCNYKLYSSGQNNLIDLDMKLLIDYRFISAEDKAIYLQSLEWHAIREKRLAFAQHKCEVCSSTESLQCHHITYERLTNEHIDDLAILCGGSNGCHQRIHDLLGYDRATEYPISILKD